MPGIGLDFRKMFSILRKRFCMESLKQWPHGACTTKFGQLGVESLKAFQDKDVKYS